MNQHSMSNTTHERARPWLEQHYQATRQRTVSLVKAAVDVVCRINFPHLDTNFSLHFFI